MLRNILFLFFLICLAGCTQKGTKTFISSIALNEMNLGAIPTAYDRTDPCNDQMNYVPDSRYPEHNPMKWIKVNFHIMHPEEGGNNFDEESAKAYIDRILFCANEKLSRNKKMNLPVGNDTPVLPTGFRYKIWPTDYIPNDDGIYHHYDDDLYFILSKGRHRNNYSRAVFKKYGIQKDSVMNIFVMGIHKDSLVSPTYKPSSNGIALGTWLKVAKWHYNAQDTIYKDGKMRLPKGPWFAQALLNHEVGHNLGLRHTWRGNDGCDDTPNHPNCWNEKKGGECAELWSNNVMDYNSRSDSWSPCQIGIAHKKMANKNDKIRKLLIKTWCEYDPEQTINIYDDVVWHGAKDLEGDIIIEPGASLTIKCRVSLPGGAKISVAPKGKLILDGATLENDCGQQWQGIEVWERNNQKGEVIARNNPKILDAEYKVDLQYAQEPAGEN